MVKFCFQTEEAANTLGDFISDAVQLWHTAGLPDEMTFTDYGNCGSYPRSKNPDYLLVILGNFLETTVGWPRLTSMLEFHLRSLPISGLTLSHSQRTYHDVGYR